MRKSSRRALRHRGRCRRERPPFFAPSRRRERLLRLVLAEEIRFRGEWVDGVEPGPGCPTRGPCRGPSAGPGRAVGGAERPPNPLPSRGTSGWRRRSPADFAAFWHVFYMCPQITPGCFEVEVLAFPNLYRLAHVLSPRLRPHLYLRHSFCALWRVGAFHRRPRGPARSRRCRRRSRRRPSSFSTNHRPARSVSASRTRSLRGVRRSRGPARRRRSSDSHPHPYARGPSPRR